MAALLGADTKKEDFREWFLKKFKKGSGMASQAGKKIDERKKKIDEAVEPPKPKKEKDAYDKFKDNVLLLKKRNRNA